MKKGLVIFVLVLAAPLYASTITFVPDPCTPGVIDWSSDVACVAMGLDVDMSSGQVDTVAVDSFFDIYMDAAFDEEAGDGYSYGEGTPIADQDAPGQIALPQTNFCISMGGLGGESEPLNDPCTSGTITFTGSGAGELDENALRGGCIDENGDTMTTNLPIPITFVELDCMQVLGVDISHPAVYAAYLAASAYFGAGNVDCWCDEYNCAGDADGASFGAAKKWVTVPDLTLLSEGWLKGQTLLPPASICADSDRAAFGAAKKWVTVPDLTILSDNWLKGQALLTHVPCPGYGP